MPVCALVAIESEFVRFQWFTEKGKNRNEMEVSWDSITEVSVFKRDVLTYDLICLNMEHSGGEPVEIDDEDELWKIFVDDLPQHLDGVRRWEEWFGEVAFPAFETNWQVIYQRG